MRKISTKAVAGVGVATGVTAALLFGGQAVSTAFTSSSDGHVHVDSANIDSTYRTGNLTLKQALPGDTSDPATISYTNNGNVPENLVLTLNRTGADLGDLGPYITVHVPNAGDFPLTSAQSSYSLGKFQPGGGFDYSGLTIHLADNAPNSVANKVLNVTYTLTATASH